ncbi:cardiac-enriched FHL2-interacting protein [Hippopotamus amphibius kiboko]|uniref:cardiac-enriched FHL2-interacting protein n=1 Tax=Hippopotamus amphibius kiboko TaxID=575201 RepID=UPI00259507D0|nr:cardiac-enriched FHL2-interacting protein [Hippopotamus amphibius kiboko]XP_057593103.1 cardiac-enriched FHL2-interacting protein [Hippopotamus amphibius kiboko]XP_057593104.1 cardiac-enriched FHL2-interacting protein [Hippopotamus amphibius kiboko]XP_057593105.1 cardiac-enriched FHL2-interacting protein [Hippopotamus amphibius kiboko]
MQGSKKCTDGFSDSSSIGSVLDEADREVSSLTDRAFRSLCISEDASFHDSDLGLSPDITRQVFGNFHQGTVSHTHRKSGIWSQLPSQGTEHAGWAATFQQLPKYVQGEEKYPKSSPPLTPAQRRLEVPVSGLRSSNKPVSKVSSLIKSFDRTESQRCDSRPPTSKPPALKNPPKFAPLPESGVNFCFDSAFLTVRRVPAEVSGTHQNSHQPPGRKHGEQESPKNPEMACRGPNSFLPTPKNAANSFESKFPSPAHKAATGESGRGQEWARRGTFLHSENSAFESWNAHQPRLPERMDAADAVPESKAPRHDEDTPSLREPKAPERKASPCHVQASRGQEENRLASGTLSTSGTWGSRDPGAQVFATEGKPSSSQPDPPLKPTHAPWRKPKPGKGGKESLQDAAEEKKQTNQRGPALYTKHNPQGQFPEKDALDMPVDLQEHYGPPFNISKLLTPVIPTKHVLESSDSQPAELTPSPPEQLNGYQEKEPSECQSRDSYKSKAPSLLFNLKDVRKRVKSTYSPSPLLKGLDEKTRGKQESLSNGGLLPNGLEESLPDELSKETPADTPSVSLISTQKDPKSEPRAASADNCLTLTSPSAITKGPFCVNGEAADRNSCEKEDTNGESEMGSGRPGWQPDSRKRLPRKHLSLKLCSGDPERARAAETLKAPGVENGFLRSISQETEPEREARLQNPNFNQKFSPGPLSPEEEDVFYSDSQSDFMPSLKSKAKFSTSSSDQSFASFEDQQKTWFTESQREDRRHDVSTGDSQKDEQETVVEEDELKHCALSNEHACVEEHSRRESVQGEEESLPGGSPRKAWSEEANFRGIGIGGSKDTALSHTKDLTPSPSSTSNKHILFAIKDNTLRATPVIKPIMLPLLRSMSSDSPLGSGHKEEELPRPGWGGDAGLCAPASQEIPSTPTPTSVRGTHMRGAACEGMEDHGWVPSTARLEASQAAPKAYVPSPSLTGEDQGLQPPLEATSRVAANNSKSSSAERGKPGAPRCIPRIALPEGDLEDQSPPRQLATCREEQAQGFKGDFLSTPRAGPPGRRLVPGELAASPNASSLEENSACSPAASSIWDDPSQAPSEPSLLQGEPPHRSPWASPGPGRVARREDLTHALTWEPGSEPQLEPSAEDLRTLSPRGSLQDTAAGSAGLLEKPEPPAQLERAAGKPPAVPPKTEKALRRAKKLASKRRKTDQPQGKHDERQEEKEKPYPEDSERRPLSPGERPRPRFPVVRSLPPPVHRHSVSAFSEPVQRRPGGPQSLTPLPPYPATQKVLQDPQSGEYFVFDLPLQVKIKTFYDPETGQYVKVSVPSSEGASPEPTPPDALAAPYVLYPGCQPLPVTALMPLRCSSQLSAPTFLRQRPHATEAAGPRPQSARDAGLPLASEPPDSPTQHSAGQLPEGPPQSPGEEGGDAPSLGIISISDLEDFATEGIS